MQEDKLDEMIKFQLKLQQKIDPSFNPDLMSYEDKVEATKQFCLYLHEEVAEVMQALKYKKYHKYEKEYKLEDVKTEIIDCLKFVLNLGILWGMDSMEFEDVFDKKSNINLVRLTSNEK
jgi:dimeric dUTPase (all-alpha-NTP-PPase superfamily)